MNPTLPRRRRTKHNHIYEVLRRHITSPSRAPGERVAPMRALAKQYDASISTVQLALQQLEEDGYVETRHGAGTFVTSRHRPITMADTVTLCMHARGHLWADLASLLMESLAHRGRLGILLGLEGEPGEAVEMVRRLAHSESDTMLVQAGAHFPFEIFDAPPMRRRTIIAVVSWDSSLRWPGLHRVLHDSQAGARLAVEHLRARGHRHVLLLGTPSQVDELAAGPARGTSPAPHFAGLWQEGGGRYTVLAGRSAPDGGYLGPDEEAFLSVFAGPEPPTAIFGCRDLEIWLAQSLLLRRRPELLSRIDVVGYGNTPWSEAGHPPFTTVDLDLERIVAEAMGVMDRVRGDSPPTEALIHVPPRLVVRGIAQKEFDNGK